MENAKKCIHCGEPITNGRHVVADIACMEYVFCYERRMIEKETYTDKFLAKHLVKYRFYENAVQKGA